WGPFRAGVTRGGIVETAPREPPFAVERDAAVPVEIPVTQVEHAVLRVSRLTGRARHPDRAEESRQECDGGGDAGEPVCPAARSVPGQVTSRERSIAEIPLPRGRSIRSRARDSCALPSLPAAAGCGLAVLAPARTLGALFSRYAAVGRAVR